MSFADLLSAESQTATLPALPYNPTGFGDVAADAYEDATFRQPFGRKLMVETDAYGERDRMIRDRFGREPDEMAGIKDQLAEFEQYDMTDPRFDAAGYSRALKSGIDRLIEEGRTAQPDLWQGIRTSAEIEETTREMARARRREFEETAAKADGVARYGGTLVGAIGGAFTDPINLATLPFGAAAGTSILRAMATEGLVNAAIEAAEAPFVYQWQKELGHKYGIGDVALDIGTAGLGGAAITGVLRGTVPALRAVGDFAGSTSMGVLDRMASSERLPASVRGAAQYMSRVAHIDEEMPAGLTPLDRDLLSSTSLTRDSLLTHRQAVQETQDALRSFREPAYPAPLLGLREFSYRATGELSPDNAARLLRRFEEPRALIEEARFEGRAQADEFVRQEARRTGADRTEYFVERIGDGKVAVFRAYKGVEPVTDESGAVKAFPSNAAAKAAAAELRGQGETAEAISLNPTARKAEQRHLVVKGITPEQAARLKQRPEYVTFFDPNRTANGRAGAEAPLVMREQPTLAVPAAARVGSDTDLATRPDNAAESLRATTDDAQTSLLTEAESADFSRLLRDQPEMKLLVDGEEKTLKEIADEIAEGETIMNAIRTCGVG